MSLVFTNGVFDILHRGHVAYLERAADYGTRLLVAINSDASARRLGKGTERPINPLADRMAVVGALRCVTDVVAFDEDTPLAAILAYRPQVLVKGGDYEAADIVGATQVRKWGGEVITIPIEHPRSTTALIERIRRLP